MRVGILTLDSRVSGPWAANQAWSAGATEPLAMPLTQVFNRCGSIRDSSIPSGFNSPPGSEAAVPRPQSSTPQPALSAPSL